MHRWPAGNQGEQCEVAALLVSAGAKVENEWLESEQVRADAAMLATLRAGTHSSSSQIRSLPMG
jgi:hypothetical protein